MKKLTLLTLFAMGVLMGPTATATEVDLVCPCEVRSIGMTGLGITAGVSNVDATASGKLRFVVISESPDDGTFYTNSFYQLTDSLPAGTALASVEVKTGIMLPPADTFYLVLVLEELVNNAWTRIDRVRMKNTISLADEGGESRLVLDGTGATLEDQSGILYFDGTPTVSVNGAQVTIEMPAIINSSVSFTTGPLALDLLQNEGPSGFSFARGFGAITQIPVSSGLGPRQGIAASSFTVNFSDSSGQDPSVTYLNLRVIDTATNTPLLYQTVRNTAGDLPVRSIAEADIQLLVDSDGDGVDNYSERLVGTEPDNINSVPGPAVVDLLVLYSQSVPALFDGDPTARFDQLVEVSNQVYANSGLNLSVRIVQSVQKTLDESQTLQTLLDLMDSRSSPFDDLDSLKAAAGADVVILMLPIQSGANLCGLANLGGFRSRGDLIAAQNSRDANGAVYLNGNCDDSTTVHEIGHIMGLGHSRRQDGNEGGTYRWAVGYGSDASFVTVMAYSSAFSDAPEVLNFSSPGLTCTGVPCGIERNDFANGADATLALKTTQYQVAAFTPTNVQNIDTDGDGTPDVTDEDDDNDGVPDVSDLFPLDAAESADTDGDGTGNNADTDDDNDGVLDTADAFPLDATESSDSDGDGIGDNADTPRRLNAPQEINLPVVNARLTSPAGANLDVPASATAVALNVTAVSPSGAGFLTVYPCGVERPLASNLNYVAGDVVPNGVIAPVGGDGSVCFYSLTETDLVVDVAGWFEGTSFEGATPLRLLDSRNPLDPAGRGVDAANPARIQVKNIPAKTAAGVDVIVPGTIKAVALNVTAVEPIGPGFLTVYPCDVARPLASNVNYVAGQIVANGVIAPVGDSGEVCIFSSVPANVVVDLAGWFPGDAFTGATPKRLVDTRDGTGGVAQQKLTPADSLTVMVRGEMISVNGVEQAIPASATAAALNVTVVNPEAAGFATVWPCSAERPLASNLNFVGNQVVANNVVAPIGDEGTVCFFTNVPSDIVVDIAGYFSGVTGNEFVGSTPVRFIDTRTGQGPPPN